ncbi:hypothetical protein JOC37_000064 [Desulfohalotomaculum tongense]|uniref:S-layer homology domain-containing protein n=1 Tax=Desulforadius tongensis TaxID=1216062 RepID=UPI00195C242E|nr:S-layer homology domain-containing protein [Desulforadius tongensis]MBM7853699.1 hypothetical protein [Desulforadius tongensis]
MRRYLPVVLLVVSLITAVPARGMAAAALPHQFADIEKHWAQEELTAMINLDILSGYAVNNRYYAKPNKPITRVEFAALMAKTLQLEAVDSQPDFADWQDVPRWARGAVAALKADGIVNGVPGPGGKMYFQPHKNITRAEIAAIIMNAVEKKPIPPYTLSFVDVPMGKWYTEPVLQAKKAGLISGRTASTFEPHGKATRAEVIVILHRFLKSAGSNPPEDEDLTAVVEDYFEDLKDVMAGDGSLSDLKPHTTGGAALALEKGGLGLLEAVPLNAGIKYVRQAEEPEVQFKSGRLAEVTGKTKVKLKGGDSLQVEVTEKYGLTKIGNKWKIYSVEIINQRVYN